MGKILQYEEPSFLKAVLKLIPGEVVAVFVFLQGILPRQLVPHLVISLLLVGLTPLYLRFALGVSFRPRLVISSLSVVVWIFALGSGPVQFLRPPYYERWYGSVALALWTLIPPMFLFGQKDSPRRKTLAARGR